MKVSAVVIARNEEENIEDCLKTLVWCNEVILVNDSSSDKTIEIAKRFDVKIFNRELSDDFSGQRNFALTKATGEWVLFVDADERVSDQLSKEILFKIKEENKDGYFIKREDFVWGSSLKHGEVGKIMLLRLGRKKAGVWEGKVHERWSIKGQTGILENPLFHFPHKNVEDFLRAVNHYSDLRAKELFEKKVKSNWFKIILYPKAKFFKNYFLQLGFLDGIPGLIHALLMSFHSFLVRAKLWQLYNG